MTVGGPGSTDYINACFLNVSQQRATFTVYSGGYKLEGLT